MLYNIHVLLFDFTSEIPPEIALKNAGIQTMNLLILRQIVVCCHFVIRTGIFQYFMSDKQ